jgi:hypothetical protein
VKRDKKEMKEKKERVTVGAKMEGNGAKKGQ